MRDGRTVTPVNAYTTGTSLDPTVLGAILAVALAALTPVILRVARRRTLAQPLLHHRDAERAVVAAVLADPRLYVYVHQLEPGHFTDSALGALWAAIAEHNREVSVPEVPGDTEKAYAVLEAAADAVPGDLVAQLRRTDFDDAAAACRDEILAAADDGALPRETLVAQASLVYNAGLDRTEFSGSARIEHTGDPDTPLVRVPSEPTVLRRAVTALLLAAGGYAAGAVGTTLADGAAASGLIAGSLVVLTVGSVVWTIVDLETMYVDTGTFWPLTGLAWVLALAAGFADGSLGDAVTGLVVVGVVVGFIEIVNQVFRRVRGKHGMGMGDYLLILATIGVPVAVSGSWMLGQVILIASLLAGIVGWVVTRLTRPGFTRESPYAFGPYLACGWMLGMLAWVVR